MGPNVKRLIAHRASHLAVPPGGTFVTALEAITSNKLSGYLKQAANDIEDAIAVFKTAPDNPYGDDDEAIAGAILTELENRKKRRG